MCLDNIKKQKQLVKFHTDQLITAAAIKHRRYHARFQSARFEGPNARHDSENSERTRFVMLLADLLSGTNTPMGRPLE